MKNQESNENAGVGSDRLVGQAKFTTYSRDLFWSLFIGGKTCRWSGYDDGYWWNNVATTDQFQVREHEGKRYRLNPETNEVFLCPDVAMIHDNRAEILSTHD